MKEPVVDEDQFVVVDLGDDVGESDVVHHVVVVVFVRLRLHEMGVGVG